MAAKAKKEVTEQECTEKIKKAHQDCPIHELLSRLADKWSVLLIITLIDAPGHRLRFSEIKKAVAGISQRMLTTTLKNLERDGLLTRHLFPEVPLRVEYALTPLGKTILAPMKDLVIWMEKNWDVIQKSRVIYDQKTKNTDK